MSTCQIREPDGETTYMLIDPCHAIELHSHTSSYMSSEYSLADWWGFSQFVGEFLTHMI